MGVTADGGQRYYISVMGQERGPHTAMELREMLRSGQIKQGETLARTMEEGSNWFPVSQIPGATSDKSWTTALILSILIGGLGVDRFYLGYTGLGILKLVTCGGLGIWSIIDIIRIATGGLGDAQGLPLRR